MQLVFLCILLEILTTKPFFFPLFLVKEVWWLSSAVDNVLVLDHISLLWVLILTSWCWTLYSLPSYFSGLVKWTKLLQISLWFYSALEFLSTCKLTNLTVRAELGCCLLHRSGRLTIDGCILQCESNPLDHLSHAIVTTASIPDGVPNVLKSNGDRVTVTRTKIEGGAKAVLTNGTLSLQQVRVIYTRTSLFFWFKVDSWQRTNLSPHPSRGWIFFFSFHSFLPCFSFKKITLSLWIGIFVKYMLCCIIASSVAFRCSSVADIVVYN